MIERVRSSDHATWLQTEEVWERITKQHPDPAKAMELLMDIVRSDLDHRHRLERSAHRREWASWWLRLARLVLGFGALLLVAFVATEFLKEQQATQGMVILLAGSVPITALFVTGRAESGVRIPPEAAAPPTV
nr:hypothetical protein [Micromonospora sp. DSM 115978]